MLLLKYIKAHKNFTKKLNLEHLNKICVFLTKSGKPLCTCIPQSDIKVHRKKKMYIVYIAIVNQDSCLESLKF